MDDTVRRNLLRLPDNSFMSAEPSIQDYSVNGVGDGCCRLCCGENCALRELFPGGYKEELLLRKIFDCTTVQISHSEDSDALICFSCVGKIEDFFQYREQCRTNDVLQRKWKRRLGHSAVARTSSLLPVVSVKSEPDDSEYFGPTELVPLDTYSDENADASAMNVSYDNSFDDPGHCTKNIESTGQEDHNLLELMSPEDSYENFDTMKMSKYENKTDDEDDEDNEADLPLQIKQEPVDIDEWADMEGCNPMYDGTSTSSALIPVIEDTSVIHTEVLELATKHRSQECNDTNKTFKGAIDPKKEASVSSMDDGQPEKVGLHRNYLGADYKIVKNAKNRTRMYADGNLYVRYATHMDGTVTWRCRKNYDKCNAFVEQYKDDTVAVFGKHDHNTSSLGRISNAKGTFAYKFILSARGTKSLVVGGYRYLKVYARANGATLWRCANAPYCKVKVSLEEDGMVYVEHTDTHNHQKSESPVGAKDEERNKVRCLNSSTSNKIKGEETSEETKTSYKSRAISVPTKSVSKMAIVKKRKDTDYRIVRNKKGFQALVYKGYRYCKVRVRQDGCIKWLCKMNRKTCKAGLYLFPDGRLEWVNALRHNHQPTHEEEIPATPRKETTVVPTTYHIDEETFASSEWYFVRNKKNGTTLMHAGYRYNKKGDRSDRSSLWRCSRAAVGCRAAIVMYPNETIGKLDQVDHNHAAPPRQSTDQPINESLQSDLGDDADDQTIVPNSQRSIEYTAGGAGDLVEEQDDPDANMRTLLNFTLGVSADDSVEEASGTVLSREEAGYRFIKNRRLTRSLLFRGYRYSKSSSRADRSIQWVCLMNRKTCKASVRTQSNGNLVLVNTQHNHDKLEEDDEEQEMHVVGNDGEAADTSGEVKENNNTTLDKETANSELPSNDDSHREDETTQSYAYYYALNRSNRECLIFQKCRYSKSTTRSDGSVFWRCMMAGGTCPVVAIVHPDGSCVDYRETEHKHPPLSILPEAVRYPPKTEQNLSSSKENVLSPPQCNTTNTLLYKQHRWKKSKILSDGVIQYVCISATDCPAMVKVRPQTGERLEIVHETPHNHQQQPPLVPAVHRRNSFPGHDGTFQLYKTVRGQLTLIHDGFRYSLRNSHADGTTSWKCRSNKRCTARFYINEKGVMLPIDAEHLSHNHEQNGQTMLWAEPIQVKDEDFSNFGNLINQCFAKLQAEETSNQKRNIIKHGGHAYTLRTVKPSGREYWRCTLFATKACRAALFCRDNGKIVEHSNGQPHTHKPIVHRVLPTRSKATPAKNTTNATTTVAACRSPTQGALDKAGCEDIELIGRLGKSLVCNGYRYYLNQRNRDGSTYYRCIRYKTEQCSAIIKLDKERKKIYPHPQSGHISHNHSPEISDEVCSPESRQLLQTLKAGSGRRDYKFERSSRGVTLCLGGYRYWSHNRLSCGWMVYRCRMQRLSGCPAVGFFNPSEGLFHLRKNQAHNHVAHMTLSDHDTNVQKQEENDKALEPLAVSEIDRDTTADGETDEYFFMRVKKDGRILLSHAGSLYAFAGKQESADGGGMSYKYNCFLEQCNASVQLLPSGRLQLIDPEHRRHMPHDMQNMENLGTGSADFRMLETSAGTAVLAFQGHRYYRNSMTRSREDDSSRWYCQSTVAYEKTATGKLRKRCFVPLVMLPNGRVSSLGKHQHPLCRALDEHMAFLIVDGHRFKLKKTLPNHSSVWRCAEHPSCGAMVYRLQDGTVQPTRTSHCHDDGQQEVAAASGTPRLRILNGTLAKSKASSSCGSSAAGNELDDIVVTRVQGTIAPTTIVKVISMTQFEQATGRRSFWYFGNRYYFYHTRADGKQYWRCSARTDECRCRAGVLRHPNGTVIPHNNEPHSHPDQQVGKTDPWMPNSPTIWEPRSYGSTKVKRIKRSAQELEEKVEQKLHVTEQLMEASTQATVVVPKVEAKMEEVLFQYKLLGVGSRNDMLLEHRGIVYTLANRRADGGRVYNCNKKDCRFQKLLLANRKLISLTHGRHGCEDACVAKSPSVTPRANDNSFLFSCKPTTEEREIEDPEDFLGIDSRIDETDHITSDATRLRLNLHPHPLICPGDDATDEERKTVVEEEEEDPSTSGWLAVEQEEIFDSSLDNDRDRQSGTDKTSSGSPKYDGEERTTNSAANKSDLGRREQRGPADHVNDDDASHEGSESRSKSRTKVLVVSAEPHESYARISLDKNVGDVSPTTASNDNNE